MRKPNALRFARLTFCAALVLAMIAIIATLAPSRKSPVVADQYFRAHAPAFASQWNLTVGSGAEYDTQCSYGVECLVDLAIVGQENFHGHQAYWMEITTRHPDSAPGDEFINKALFYLDGKNIVFPEAITQLPGHAPVVVPSQWIFTWARGELALASGYIEPYRWGLYSQISITTGVDSCAVISDRYQECYFQEFEQIPNGLPGTSHVGDESITIPAGTFAAEHWRFHAAPERWRAEPDPMDVWIAKNAGPFGIVRVRMHDHAVGDQPAKISYMSLDRVFTDAQDKITGAPQQADPAELWQWLYQGRKTLLTWCVPSLGLPECCFSSSD
jgi:hypothetical protein